jgi:hypothetical protein
VKTVFLSGMGAGVMTSYEFAYFGRDLQTLQHTIASWCSGRECFLEITALLQGARLRISGPDETIREAIRMVRVWMRRTS